MRVTKEQVERLAEARREYEFALRDITDRGKPVKWVGEPVKNVDMLRDMAEAAGERVEREKFDNHESHRFYSRGVEFYCLRRVDGGDA